MENLLQCDILNGQAEQLIQSKNYIKALEKLKRSQQIHPTVKGCRYQMICWVQTRKFDQFWDCAQSSIELLNDTWPSQLRAIHWDAILNLIKEFIEYNGGFQAKVQNLYDGLKTQQAERLVSSEICRIFGQIQKQLQVNDEYLEILTLCKNPPKQYEQWFLISKNWWQRWEDYHNGESETSPGPIDNSNIIEQLNKKDYYLDSSKDKQYTNVRLKQGLIENKDYVLIPQTAYRLLNSWYGNDTNEIKRWTISEGQGRFRVEVKLREIKITPIPPLNDGSFDTRKALVSNSDLVSSIKEKITRILQQEAGRTKYNLSKSRLWKLKPNQKVINLFNKLGKKKQTFDEIEEMKENIRLQDANIADEDDIIIEYIRKDGKWELQANQPKASEQCGCCKKSGNLMVCTGCRQIKYCSKKCQNTHWKQHKQSCNKRQQTGTPRQGLVGLQNLGNTCFMNSALQCVSHTIPLTNYFLQGNHNDEINTTNPLGTGGRIAREYASLLKELWQGSSSYFSPFGFKRTIATVASQFTGYQQHDSQELLSYLLDSLHEDLNRVINKPIVEAEEALGRADEEVAQISWQKHLSRNQSQIVDLMHGQCKSTLQCPQCDRISVTFDPFLTYTVTIPNYEVNKRQLYYKTLNAGENPIKVDLMLTLGTTCMKLKEILIEEFQYDQIEIFSFNNTRLTGPLSNSKELADLVNDTLMAIQLPDDFDTIVPLIISKSQQGKRLNRSPMSYIRPLFLRKEMTITELYYNIMTFFELQIQELTNIEVECTKECIEKLISEQNLFKLNIVNPYYGYFYFMRPKNCPYCDKQKCTNCILLPDDDTTIQDLMEKSRELKLEIVWNPQIKSIPSLNQCSNHPKRIEISGPKRTTTVTLQECIEHVSKPEKLDKENSWYCNVCKEHVEAWKSYEIYSLPKILIIHLKRFKSRGYYNEKLTTPVEFPIEGLDLTSFCLRKQETPLIYDLYAVSNHMGILGGGHYTAYVKNPTAGWVEMDDTRVSRVDPQRVVSKNAYILFYQLRDS